MTGLTMGDLPNSDLERPRAIALDFHKSNLRSHTIAVESGVLSQGHVSLCQPDFVLKWS
jgi:hypothetical protein